MTQGGISLLSITAADADDAQTLRMVAGAIANLCGNGMFVFFGVIFFASLFEGYTLFVNYSPTKMLEKLQTKLRTEGGIKALLGIVRCGHPDVLSQVARGIANFAKCESRASSQGKSIDGIGFLLQC